MSSVCQSPSAPATEPLTVEWIHGSESSKHNTDPDIQVYWFDENTAILRQNKAINYEAPFLYLLFGDRRAALLDTGATASPELFPLRRVVDELVDSWLSRHFVDDYSLVVTHTHSHDDHVAGDDQFVGRPIPSSSGPTVTQHGSSSGSPRMTRRQSRCSISAIAR